MGHLSSVACDTLAANKGQRAIDQAFYGPLGPPMRTLDLMTVVKKINLLQMLRTCIAANRELICFFWAIVESQMGSFWGQRETSFLYKNTYTLFYFVGESLSAKLTPSTGSYFGYAMAFYFSFLIVDSRICKIHSMSHGACRYI